jgi:hypothetical protein
MFKSISFVTAHYRAIGQQGGQRSRFMHEVACQVLESNVLCPDVDSLSGLKVNSEGVEGVTRVNCPTFPTRSLFPRLISQLVFGLKLLVIKSDKSTLYVLNNNPVISYLLLGIKYNCLGIKYVLDVRDYPLHLIFSKYRYLSYPLKCIDRFIIGNRHGSISVTNGLRNVLNLSRAHDFVVELGTDTNSFISPSPGGYKPMHCANLVYVGSLNNYFELSGLCSWLEEHNFKGTLDYYGWSSTSSLVKYGFFNDKGSTSKDSLHSLLSRYDYGIFATRSDPSSSYLLGNKVFDYISSGIPILYFGNLDTTAFNFISTKNVGLCIDAASGYSRVPEAFCIENFESVQLEYCRSGVDNKLLSAFKSLIGVNAVD